MLQGQFWGWCGQWTRVSGVSHGSQPRESATEETSAPASGGRDFWFSNTRKAQWFLFINQAETGKELSRRSISKHYKLTIGCQQIKELFIFSSKSLELWVKSRTLQPLSLNILSSLPTIPDEQSFESMGMAMKRRILLSEEVCVCKLVFC